MAFDSSRSVVAQWNELALEAIRLGDPVPTEITRALHIAHSAIYDAWAAYDAEAAGYYFQGVATGEDTQDARAEAVNYAAFHALSEVFPDQVYLFKDFLTSLGFDPDLETTDLSTPGGVGIAAAQTVISARANDGANSANDFEDTSGYEPGNSDDPDDPDFDPNLWTPLRVPTGAVRDENGIPIATDNPASYKVQEPISPHWGSVDPFAIEDSDDYLPPAPPKLGDFSEYVDATGKVTTGDAAYREQFGALVDISANLTTEQKVIAEYWADGPQTSTPPGHWNEIAQDVSVREGYGLDEDVKLFFALNNALFDAGIAIWDAKYTYDYVRPQTAIRHLYDGETISSWAGPNQGTQDIAGGEWIPYQNVTFVTPAFPEYTSGHSGFSYAAATIIEAFTGTDVYYDGTSRGAYDLDGDGERDLLGQYVTDELAFEDGSGDTVTLQWASLWDAAAEAGLSRLYGGIHIQDGDLFGRQIGAEVAEDVWGATRLLFDQDGDNVFDASEASTFHLGAGSDEIIGALADLDGLQVFDFGRDDVIRVSGLALPDGGFAISPGSAVLELDQDGDGTADAIITLEGDYDDDRFIAVEVDGQTTLRIATDADVELTDTAERFITTDASANVVAAGDGDDVLVSAGGGDVLDGDGGNDVLLGGDEDDILIGGGGGDVTTGGAGADIFSFDASDAPAASGFTAEFITDFESGVDKVELSGYVGLSFDTFSWTPAEAGVALVLPNNRFIVFEGIDDESELSAQDFVFPTSGRDVVFAESKPQILTDADDRYVSSGSVADDVDGRGGDDAIITGDGADFLGGGIGDDVLNAGAGEDTLAGGSGADNLTGGADADLFRFFGSDDPAGSGFVADFVTDYEAGIDRFEIFGFAGIGQFSDISFLALEAGLGANLGGGRFIVFEGVFDQADLNEGDFTFTGDAPDLALALRTDTGTSASDQVTSDEAIIGGAFDDVGIVRVEVRIEGQDDYKDATSFLQEDGNFVLDALALEELFGTPVADGLATYEVRVTDIEGNQTEDTISYTLDRAAASVADAPSGIFDVSPDTLTVAFTEAMANGAFDATAYALRDGAGQSIEITSIDRINDTTARLNLADTLRNDDYTLEIPAAADIAGNAPAEPTNATFTVDALTRIVNVGPTEGTKRANLDRQIVVEFDRPVDRSTVDAESFQVIALGEPLEGRITVSSNGQVITFFPDDLLPAATELRIKVDGDKIIGEDGSPIDADGDGSPGGTLESDFQTITLTRVPDTNIEGFIFDANYRDDDGLDIPLEGVVVSVVGLPNVSAVTDENGRFFLEDLPIPQVYLEFDASNVTNRPDFDYGTIDKPVDTIAGQTVGLSSGDKAFNIYFAALAEGDVTEIIEGEETEAGIGENGLANLTEIFPNIDPSEWEKLKVTIPADSLSFDDGTLAEEVSVMVFEPDRIPAPLPPGFDPTVVFTVKAGDATNVDGKAQIDFPNLDGLALGEKRPILSFDHDAGEWVQSGTAIVVDDGNGGTVLRSEGDTGVNTLGWKFLGIPLNPLNWFTSKKSENEQSNEPDLKFDDYDKHFERLDPEYEFPPEAQQTAESDDISLTELDEEKDIELKHYEAEGTISEEEHAKIVDDLLSGDINSVIDNDDFDFTTDFKPDLGEDGKLSVGDKIKIEGDVIPNLPFDNIEVEVVVTDIEISNDGKDVAITFQTADPDADNNQTDNHPVIGSRTFGVSRDTDEGKTRIFNSGASQNNPDGPFLSGPVNDIGNLDEGNFKDFQAGAKKRLEDAGATDVVVDGETKRVKAKEVAPDPGGTEAPDAPERAPSAPNLEPFLLSALTNFDSSAPGSINTLTQNSSAGNSEFRFMPENAYYLIDIPSSESQPSFQLRGQYTSIAPNLFLEQRENIQVHVLDVASMSIGYALFDLRDLGGVEFEILTDIDATGPLDFDEDGLSDLAERIIGTDATSKDSDNDGILDGAEIEQGLNPLDDVGFPTGVIGGLSLGGEAKDLTVIGDLNGEGQTAFIATGSHGLAIVDASQFSNPILVGELNLPGTAEQVSVDAARNLAFVAAGDAGLHIVDVSDPNMPELLSTTVLSGETKTVLSLDGVVVAGADGLSVLSATGELLAASYPSNPVLDIKQKDGKLFVLTDFELLSYEFTGLALELIDTVELPFPTSRRTSSQTTIDNPQLFIQGDTAYISNGYESAILFGNNTVDRGGYVTVDLSDPADLQLISDVSTPEVQSGFADMALNGSGLAVVASGFLGVQIHSASDPANTYGLLTQVDTDGSARAIEIASGIAYVADGSGGLKVINYLPFDNKGQAPTISIDTDASDIDPGMAGIQIVEGETVRISTSITDDEQVRNVELLVNGEVVLNDVSPPFDLSFSAPRIADVGDEVTVEVRATDTGGNRQTSDPILFFLVPDTVRPEVFSISLEDGDFTLSGNTRVQVQFTESMDITSLDLSNVRLIVPAEEYNATAIDVVLIADDSIVQFVFEDVPTGDGQLSFDLKGATDRSGNLLLASPETINLTLVEQPIVSIENAAVEESASSFDSNALEFIVELSNPFTEEVTVFYRLLSGTGTAGAEGDAYPGPGPRSPVSEASVTFAPGETSKTIPIWTAGNASGSEPAELDEAVVLQAFSVQGAAFAGGGSTLEATGWILDIDGSENPLAGFVSRPNIVEGDAGEKNAIFEISFSRPIPEAITLSYETVDGGAEAGSDYTAVSGTIDLVAGQTVAAVSVPVLGDTDVEFSESFTLAVSTTSTAVAEIAQGQATILDDDAGGAQPTVSIAPAASNESFDTFDSNALIFAATLSEAATEEVTVFYRLLSGTGTAGAEGDAYPGPGPRSPVSEASVTFAPGETSKTIPIWTAGNASGSEPAELDEAVVLQAFSVQGAAFAGGGSTLEATGWILDIDGSENPLAGFVSRPNIVEGDAGEKNAIFEISFSRPIPEAITLSYETVDGGAEAGSDYTAVSGTIDLVAGQTVAAVSVPVLGDTDVEFSESFTLAVSTTSTAVAEIAQGQATILDDDAGGAQPTVSIAPAASNESFDTFDSNALIFAATLSEAATEEVTVFYRLLSGTGTAGAEGDAYPGPGPRSPVSEASVTFAPGETSKTIPIWTAGNASGSEPAELDEAVVLQAFSVQGAAFAGGGSTLEATGWILDIDGSENPLAGFVSRPNIVEGDAGEKNAIFEISFSRPIPEAITLSYETVDGGAEAGSDYTAVSGTIDLVAGQTVAAVSVPVLGDTDVEFSESFTLAVSTTSTAVAEIAQGQATILDDDAGGAQPTVSIAPAASNESFDTFDSNALIFAATLSEAATEEVTVFYRLLSGTGTAGAEGDAYPGPGPRSPVSEASVTFAPGETSKTIPIWTAGNASGSEPAELDEAVVLQAFSVQGAAFAGGGSTLEATGWILDIDGSENPLAGFVSRPNIVEGDAGEKNAIFEISFSRPIPEAITLSYETVDGGAEAGSDYTAVSGTIDLVAGQTVAAVSVPVLGDTDVEFSESFTLAVSTTSTAVAEIAQGQATILDDDAGGAQPTVSIAPAASNESFDTFDSNALIFAATLSEAATEEVTVFYRLLSGTGTAGAEGDAYPGPGPRSPVSEASVTFAPGETSKTIPIWTAGNASGSEPAELDEAVVLQAFSVQGAAFAGGGSTLEATGWILDIDGSENPLAGFVSRPNIVEGDAGEKNAIFEISFSRPIPEAITLSYETVDGGAEAGSDYTAVSGTIDLVAGQTVAAVSVPVLGDTDVEFSESFTLAVSTTSTAVAEIAQGQATILDDDAIELLGREGSDVFVFTSGDRSGVSTDAINGLEVGIDRVVLDEFGLSSHRLQFDNRAGDLTLELATERFFELRGYATESEFGNLEDAFDFI